MVHNQKLRSREKILCLQEKHPGKRRLPGIEGVIWTPHEPFTMLLVMGLGTSAAQAFEMLRNKKYVKKQLLLRDGLGNLKAVLHGLIERIPKRTHHPNELVVFWDAAIETWPPSKVETVTIPVVLRVFREIEAKFDRVLTGSEDSRLLDKLKLFCENLVRYAEEIQEELEED